MEWIGYILAIGIEFSFFFSELASQVKVLIYMGRGETPP